MVNQKIYDYLRESGCCKICCLRYFKSKGIEYDNVLLSLERLGITSSDDPCEDPADNIDEIQVKKLKTNTCSACLGLFSTHFLNDVIERIVNNPELKQYDCKQIVVAISFPMLYHIRQLSFWLGLLEKFNGEIATDKAPDIPLKEVAKLIINPKLCKKLDKTYDSNGIMINIFFNHECEGSVLKKILNVEETLLYAEKKTSHKKIEITRGLLEKKFIPSRVTIKEFTKEFSVPPTIPSTDLILERISFNGPTVFVGGRYKKLSRQLSHSPWIIQGKRIMEDSIQEIIVRNVAPLFSVPNEKIVFSSSGREDIDVRCLGNGRPFLLEIPNSKRVSLTTEEAASIEIEIEKCGKVSVQHLQIVKREEIVHIKTGEETKKKFYRALCKLKKPATIELMEKLNLPNGFQIEQLTPIRVLHRRPLHKRPRTIYSLKGSVDRNNHTVIILDIVTQAGTYVKELVHGEFGRTTPSIQSIIGECIDIMALDVTGIDLDWPKNIQNR